MTTRYALKKARPDISGRDDSAGRTEVKANGYVLGGATARKNRPANIRRSGCYINQLPLFLQGSIGGHRPALTPVQWTPAGHLIGAGVPRQQIARVSGSINKCKDSRQDTATIQKVTPQSLITSIVQVIPQVELISLEKKDISKGKTAAVGADVGVNEWLLLRLLLQLCLQA
ncbi:hypothetical protein QDY85_002958 [Salmonella enterica]|nr:hypothetical protein [Salmonella enterica]EHY69921.1 hypothetical protein SEHO0A_00974 [Salmonella enterica subsp. houtenae str. ATCC BAA-1581]QQI31073.1 hypothetical protein HFS24_13600 [Salmonella enterica subsp. houtenae serovar 43:z4]HCM1979172.1 hypothetical protein [Salmonella enterica subsp. houtenae serovar 41:z36:-]HCM2020115.1 hypothetical protein [Salmonella enterica subsp. houtenae serovar 48:g,z51:-]